MKLNLNLLPIKINDTFLIPENFYENTSIKGLDEVKVNGIIKYNAADEIQINLDVNGDMELIDAVTNEPIRYPFSFQIDEILEENDENLTKYFEKSQNILDIIEFLWENIVLEVPIRVTNTTGVHLKGKGWELNSEKKDDGVDPRFEKLNELFKGGE